MVWDKGFWKPEGDPAAAYRDGHLSFVLSGKKLKGRWSLVRISNRNGNRSSKPQWLLIKAKDEYAVPSAAGDVLSDAPDSAVSNRSLESIANATRKPAGKNRKKKAPPRHSATTARKPASRAGTPPKRHD